jgi:hypothetical protein
LSLDRDEADNKLDRVRGEKNSRVGRLVDDPQRVIIDFLDSWRFCPVSEAKVPARSCIEDAAGQLLAALTQPPADPEAEIEDIANALVAGPRCGGREEIERDGTDDPCPGCPDCQSTPELLGEEVAHELKCWPPYFEEVLTGRKPFEVRKIEDRWFKVGQTILLREYDRSLKQRDPETDDRYTGRSCLRRITYILGDGDWGIEKGTVVLGLASTQPVSESPGNSGEDLENYERCGLADEVIERLEAREAEAAKKLEEWKADHPGRHDSPSALVFYTEKRIYRDAILAVADTDLEGYVFGRATVSPPRSTGGNTIQVARRDSDQILWARRLPDGPWHRLDDLLPAHFADRLSTQPVPGNRGGVEEEEGKLHEQLAALVRAAVPVESGEASEEDRETFSEAFQDACFLLASIQVEREHAASTQPPSPQAELQEVPLDEKCRCGHARRDHVEGTATVNGECLVDGCPCAPAFRGTGETVPGKQPPAEPQVEVAARAIAEAGDSLFAWEQMPDGIGNRSWKQGELLRARTREDCRILARAVVTKLTPLLALEVKERLESAETRDRLMKLLKDESWLCVTHEAASNMLDFVIRAAALDTPAPSEPREEKT